VESQREATPLSKKVIFGGKLEGVKPHFRALLRGVLEGRSPSYITIPPLKKKIVKGS